MERPETRFAWHGDAALAYQVLGHGGPDLVVSQSWVTNVELYWEHAMPQRFFRELSRNRRVIVMDPRGHGCSERASSYDVWPLETLVQDLLTVLDDTGSERALILGMDMCGPVACMFAATYPERTSGLILYETAANWLWSEETPWEWTEEEWEVLERERSEAGVRPRSRSAMWKSTTPRWSRMSPTSSGGDGFNSGHVRRATRLLRTAST